MIFRTSSCKLFFRAALRCFLPSLFFISPLGNPAMLRGQDRPAAEPSLICVDPLQKVFRDATDLPPAEPEARAAVGEYATIQFVFRSPMAVADLQASVSGDVPEAAVRCVGYVKVGRSYKGAPADVLKSADGTFPDPLLEDKAVAVAANQNQPIWITVPAKSPGVLQGKLTVRWNGGEIGRPFTVRVHNVKMNKPRLGITNWWFSDAERLSMLAGRKVEPFSDEYWKLIRQFADFMAQYRQNMVLISPLDLAQIGFKDEKFSFDFSRFDKTVQTFIDAGVIGRIEGGHIGGRSSGNWNSPFFVRVPEFSGGAMAFANKPATDAAARRFYAQYLPALAGHLAARGWDKIYYQHLADEPVNPNAASYRDIANLVREFAPGMRVIEATQTRALVGSVDAWVPILDHYHKDIAFFRERQKAGDEVWFYTCCGPTGQYANRFIELPLIKTRLLHWINFRYGATGYLHWGFNYWNPGSSPFAETTFQWPGGDQWIVYPKDGKLLSSIRLEAMRDGIGDHELLSMLAEKDSAAAQKLAAELILDFDRYDADIAHFRALRRQLLEALEK
ncbi:MAG: DUF4091 domain-containing protein [Pirellulales bacterium]|nr:DUF4091 domain-containing protein [Pirellulales bacterium]